jgi:site-specific DNA-methyltransferase (cytosine-N4-specific)
LGAAYVGDANELLAELPDESVNLVITSPPFALQRQKEYGNRAEEEYVEWLLSFEPQLKRVLKNDGSFVLDLGGAYQKGRPTRSLYNYKVLLRMCEERGWHLAQEFFWYNPAKLPSPIEWVNKRKVRVKDAVNTIWWFSKTEYPKANVSEVLRPYSERMIRLLIDREKFYTAKRRPSGHDISWNFMNGKAGAIPPNLLEIPNTESNSRYLRLCAAAGVRPHPARFPARLPEFFIRFLTVPGDLVLDIFAGSNTTGMVAEQLGRRWLAFDSEQRYLAASVFRFLPEDPQAARSLYLRLTETPPQAVDLSALVGTVEQRSLW